MKNSKKYKSEEKNSLKHDIRRLALSHTEKIKIREEAETKLMWSKSDEITRKMPANIGHFVFNLIVAIVVVVAVASQLATALIAVV